MHTRIWGTKMKMSAFKDRTAGSPSPSTEGPEAAAPFLVSSPQGDADPIPELWVCLNPVGSLGGLGMGNFSIWPRLTMFLPLEGFRFRFAYISKRS